VKVSREHVARILVPLARIAVAIGPAVVFAVAMVGVSVVIATAGVVGLMLVYGL
jgi:hypothetical protein